CDACRMRRTFRRHERPLPAISVKVFALRFGRMCNLRATAALACVAVPSALSALCNAQQPSPPRDVWSLELGTYAAELPNQNFSDYACGTNGGPPSVGLIDFTEFGRCPPDGHGLREVYFRYDDEMEYRARALRNDALINRYAGTRVFTFQVILSALFDD